MREFFTIAIFKIKADIRMNKTALNSQKEKHSMLSLRRATFVGLAAHRLRNISIHALLAESDYWLPVRHSRTEAFLSTLSLRRATAAEHRLLALNSISIHALLAESDLIHITQYSMCKISIHALLAESDKPDKKAGSQEKDFYPRSPCGERPFFYSLTACRQYFYPRSPCGERRAPTAQPVHPHSHFYPRSPCGERL